MQITSRPNKDKKKRISKEDTLAHLASHSMLVEKFCYTTVKEKTEKEEKKIKYTRDRT